MKKIFIVFLFVLFSLTVKATEEDIVITNKYIPRIYYNYLEDGVIHWGQMTYNYINDNLVYCLDITKTLQNSEYEIMSVENMDYDIILMAYFGYGYNGNTSVDYYIATQELIWNKLGYSVYFTNYGSGQGNIVSVTKYKNEILSYVNVYKNNPNLIGETNFNLGNRRIITNSGDILSEYNLINNSSNNISVSDNKVYLEANEVGSFEFTLNKSYNNLGENKLFHSEDSQDLLYVGNVMDKVYNYSYTIQGGRLVISLYDKYNDNQNFSGNVFNLYDSNSSLIGAYETDSLGKLTITSLKVGSYKIIHEYTNDRYKINKTLYEFEIKDTGLNKAFGITLSPKEINFNIKKTFGNPILGTIYSDDNVKFAFYASNELKNVVSTDDSGMASLKLIYDNYTVVQENINKVSKKSDDYVIQYSDFNGDNYYNIYTPVYDSNLKIHLYETGDIPISNAIFYIDEKEYITNNDGEIVVGNLKEGRHIIRQENIDGYIVNDEMLFVLDENCNFYLEDNESFVDLILYNEKRVESDDEEVTLIPDVVPEAKDDIAEEQILKDEVVIAAEEPFEELEMINDEEKQTNEIDVLPNLYTFFFELDHEIY